MQHAHIRKDYRATAKPANHNRHDQAQWEFAHYMSDYFRSQSGIAVTAWHNQQAVHYLYEFFNAQHLSQEDRLWLASRYLQDKIEAIRHNRPQIAVVAIYADPIFAPRQYADKHVH